MRYIVYKMNMTVHHPSRTASPFAVGKLDLFALQDEASDAVLGDVRTWSDEGGSRSKRTAPVAMVGMAFTVILDRPKRLSFSHRQTQKIQGRLSVYCM